MTRLNYRAPRLSRAKALIGEMAATLALTGVVQAAGPVSASAMKPRYAEYCMDVWSLLVYYKDRGNKELEKQYADLMMEGNCWGAISGI